MYLRAVFCSSDALAPSAAKCRCRPSAVRVSCAWNFNAVGSYSDSQIGIHTPPTVSVLKVVGTAREAGDVIGVPVGHDDERHLTAGRLHHVGDGGFDAADVAGLAGALEHAAVDDDMHRLARRRRGH